MSMHCTCGKSKSWACQFVEGCPFMQNVGNIKLPPLPFEIHPQETICLDKTVELWNELVKLETQHQDDINELRFHIHAIQNAIAARVTFRIIRP